MARYNHNGTLTFHSSGTWCFDKWIFFAISIMAGLILETLFILFPFYNIAWVGEYKAHWLLVDPRGAEGYCSCVVQNWMGVKLTAWYMLHTLKVWCHYGSLDKLYKWNVWIVSPSPHSKVGWFLVIFAVRPMHFVWGEFVFAPTVPYTVHLLKVHCHSVSLGKLYKWNVWIVRGGSRDFTE